LAGDKKLLIKNLRPRNGTDLAGLQLAKVRQESNEKLDDYIGRVKQLLQNLNLSYDPDIEQITIDFISKENDKKARRAFEDGIKDKELRMRVVTANLPTLQEATDYALEQEIRMKESFGNTIQSIQCNFCQKMGHKEFDCRNKKAQRSANTYQPRPPATPCPKCGKRGHWAKDCWSNQQIGNNNRYGNRGNNCNNNNGNYSNNSNNGNYGNNGNNGNYGNNNNGNYNNNSSNGNRGQGGRQNRYNNDSGQNQTQNQGQNQGQNAGQNSGRSRSIVTHSPAEHFQSESNLINLSEN